MVLITLLRREGITNKANTLLLSLNVIRINSNLQNLISRMFLYVKKQMEVHIYKINPSFYQRVKNLDSSDVKTTQYQQFLLPCTVAFILAKICIP